MDVVRFGFLGAGGIATGALAPAVHEAAGAELLAVAARDPARAVALEPRRVAADYAAVVDDPDVDIVYVALQNDAHRPWVLAALAAGKHVLCEKPLGLTAAEVVELQQAAAAADRLLVEALWYRWHPRTRWWVDRVTAGDLGDVRRVSARFVFDRDLTGDYRLQSRHGGGAVYDVGCYAMSAAVAAFGDTAPRGLTEVLADLRPDAEGRPVDLGASAIASWEDGRRAALACGMAGPSGQHLAVEGSAGRVELPGEPFTSHRSASSALWENAQGDVDVVRFDPVATYAAMVEQVAAAVRGEETPLVGPEHSLAVARGVDAWRAGLVGSMAGWVA